MGIIARASAAPQEDAETLLRSLLVKWLWKASGAIFGQDKITKVNAIKAVFYVTYIC